VKKLTFIILCSLFFTSISLPQVGYGSEVSGDLFIPIGKNASDFNLGFGGLAGFYYDITENFRMGLVLGYLYSSINQSNVNNDFASSGQLANVKGGVGVIPALISVRLVSPGPGMRFYGLLEGGLYTYSTSISGSYPGGAPIDQSEFRSEPGIAVGGGVLLPLKNDISLDISVRYHWVQDSEYINYEGTELANSQAITIGVGANWFFPL
jgi:opacity protein-like surface antigen